jgi:hypothetical protein
MRSMEPSISLTTPEFCGADLANLIRGVTPRASGRWFVQKNKRSRGTKFENARRRRMKRSDLSVDDATRLHMKNKRSDFIALGNKTIRFNLIDES